MTQAKPSNNEPHCNNFEATCGTTSSGVSDSRPPLPRGPTGAAVKELLAFGFPLAIRNLVDPVLFDPEGLAAEAF